MKTSLPTRRDLAALLLCAAPVATSAEQSEPDADHAVTEMKKSLAAVSKFEVPMATEPMFAFRVY